MIWRGRAGSCWGQELPLRTAPRLLCMCSFESVRDIHILTHQIHPKPHLLEFFPLASGFPSAGVELAEVLDASVDLESFDETVLLPEEAWVTTNDQSLQSLRRLRRWKKIKSPWSPQPAWTILLVDLTSDFSPFFEKLKKSARKKTLEGFLEN